MRSIGCDEVEDEEDNDDSGGGAANGTWTDRTSGAVAVDESSALLVRVVGARDSDGWVVRCVPGTTPSIT